MSTPPASPLPSRASAHHQRPVIVAALRTPIGTAGQAFASVPAANLAAPVLAAVVTQLAELGVAADDVSEVVLGNCMGPGGDVARVASLLAGIPIGVPALTVDRQCASGLAALEVAAGAIALGAAEVVLAGGMESASTAPLRYLPADPAVPGSAPQHYERAPFAPLEIGDPDMGVAADLLAAEAGIGRQRQDEYAAESHRRAYTTQQAGGFDAELVAVGDVHRDERPRRGLTAQRLSRLRPTFSPQGTATAGNSCGVNDGAAVTALVSAAIAAELALPGLRVVATASAGVDPNRPGLGLVPAVQLALTRAEVGIDDLDVIELNEAFAGQTLACCDALDLDPGGVCVEGGALALGHPWGASGAVLVVRLFAQMVHAERGRYGLAAIAAGGGQGVAMVVERCP